jgi:uncharacterized lipoprotein YmbA
MESYSVSDKQSLIDVATQKLGGLDNLYALAVANEISIADELQPGQAIVLVDVSNDDVAGYLSKKGVVPATAITTLTEEQARIFTEEFDETFE